MDKEVALTHPELTKNRNLYFKTYLDGEVPVAVLTHHVLLDMGHGGLKAYFDDLDCRSETLKNIRRIWQHLLNTTQNTSVTDRHLTAACNAICVFLECSCSSLLPRIRGFGMAKETWLQCFGAILESFEKGKLKPMRQVLITLANILTHHPENAVSSSIQKEVMARLTEIVLLGDADYMKAALVALEFFIRRISSFDDVLSSIARCSQDKQVEWSRRLASVGLENATEELSVQASISDAAVTGSDCRTTLVFVFALLMALLSRDTQSAAIALFKTYSTALIGSGRGNHLYSMSVLEQDGNAELEAGVTTKTLDQSRWISPVNALLAVHPAAVTPFMDFLYPEVFRHDPNAYKEYADSLQSGDCNLINLLAVVQVGCYNGLERGKLRRRYFIQVAMQRIKILTPTPDPMSTLRRTIPSIDTSFGQEKDIYGVLLSHADADVRARTFALLLASSSTTAPLSNTVLWCLASHLKYLYGNSDPQNRSEVMSIVRKLVIRLQGGAYFLHKSLTNPQSRSEGELASSHSADLRQHKLFLYWFAKFLEDELRPNVSYQRHIMALKSINLLVRSGVDDVIAITFPVEVSRNPTPWPIHVSLRHSSLTCALLNLVLDPFEDVRIVSSMLLEILASASVLPMYNHVCQVVGKAEEQACRTGRADHADGAARLYKLYYILSPDPFPDVNSLVPSKHMVVEEILSPVQQALGDVEGDLLAPLQQLSLHARLLGLRYLIQDRNFPGDLPQDVAMISLQRKDLVQRLIFLCQQVWQKVRHRLCIDSPENSEDELNEELMIGPKDMLSYSWRALRDSSLLICAIVDAPIFREQGSVSASTLQCFEKIGALCMEQLSDLRHRGAFSTVAQTFSVLCERISESHDNSVVRLRDIWYNMALTTLGKQATRLTRRSAGLPAMMAGLLNACPQVFFQQFCASFTNKAMKPNNLSALLPGDGDQQIELPQVHAMNCLREVFTNARFRPMTESHVMDMLELATTSLGSDVWAIRNCGLMLFRACTGRLGRARISILNRQDPTRSRTNEATVSNDKALGIFDLVINLMDTTCFSQDHNQSTTGLQPLCDPDAGNSEPVGTVATEKVFAGLDLMGRISPSFRDAGQIEHLIFEKLASTVWQVRERASTILASRVLPSDAFNLLGRLVAGMFTRKDQNMVHGRLLCIRQILHSLWLSGSKPHREYLSQEAAILAQLIAPIMTDKMSSVVRTTFLDIMNEAFEMEVALQTAGGDSTDSVFWVGEAVYNCSALSDGPGFPKHESAALQETYHLFLTQSRPEQKPGANLKLRQLFRNLSKCDLDAAARFLDRITPQTSWSRNIRLLLDDLYQFIILTGSFPEDLRSRAMTGLTISIERNQLNPQRCMTLNQIPCSLLCESEATGRRLRNVKLRLQANLFSLESQETSHQHCQVCEKGQYHVSLWVAMLQDASRDNTDTPTRLDAAYSLLAFSPLLVSKHKDPSLSSCYLQIYLILYELLNDDDEDVREVAASAASTILDSEQTAPRTHLKRSPLAASENLAVFLATEFRSEPEFPIAVLGRIWFPYSVNRKRGNFERNIEYFSTRVVLQDLQQDSSTLFEEEKQNLYVDDIQELQIWSNILKSSERPEIGLLNSLGDWVLAALRDLKDDLNDKADFEWPLGLTFQADILTLFVRVIELAGVVLHWTGRHPNQVQESRSARISDADTYASHLVASILLELKALDELGSRVSIHERIKRSIDYNLKIK